MTTRIREIPLATHTNNDLPDNVTREAESRAASDSQGQESDAFRNRMVLLIEHFGSAAEIARRCGFSEAVVRSWRDGNSDPSRARCVALARGTGASLLWLVAGQGPMWDKDLQPNERDTALIALGDPASDEVRAANRRRDEQLRAWSAGFAAGKAPEAAPHKAPETNDAEREAREQRFLATAIRIVDDALHKYELRSYAKPEEFAELVRIVLTDLKRGAAEDAASAALARVLNLTRTPHKP